MTILNKCVLLLKAQKSEGGHDKYELLLKDNNFQVKQVKTLDFVFKGLDILREKLNNPDDYGGIIFSSPRCVDATFQAFDGCKLANWTSKHNFVVGEATYKDALDKLGLNCRGKETGNANNLAKFIIDGKDDYGNPFLFPHGNLKTDTLKTELGKENLSMEGVLVYDTIPNPSLELEIKEATDNFTNVPEYVVFFSPSGVRSTVGYLRNLPVDMHALKFIAIGPVTEKAIEEENLCVHASAKNPTPEDVLNAIINN